MVNQQASVSASSSQEPFGRGRARLLSSLSCAVATWPASLEAHLLKVALSPELNAEQKDDVQAAARRFKAGQLSMVSRLETCLEGRSAQALGKVQSLSQGAQLMQLLREVSQSRSPMVVQMAVWVRQETGEQYVHWLARNASLVTGLAASPELDEIHPLGAPLLAECVFSALSIGSGERNGRLERLWPHLHSWLTGTCVVQIASAISDANGYLRDCGVLRSLGSPHPVQSGMRAVQETQTITMQVASPDPIAADPMVAATAADNLPTNALAQDVQKPTLVRVPSLAAVKALESDAVAFAHRASQIPYSRKAREAYFQAVREAVALAKGLPAAGAIVDVVSALFDYVVDEDRLPDAAKPLVWRLQQPVVLLALLDSRYLAAGQRSVRSLVENLAAIATGFSDEMVPGRELFQRIETAVRAVEIVASMLYSRSQILSQQVGKHFQLTAQQMATIANRVANERKELESTPRLRNRRRNRSRPNREAEQLATEQLRAMLEEKLSLYSVPDSVGEFLRKIWIRHLRTALLRDGAQSGSYKTAMRVVDDLLWSADLDAPKTSRRQLTSRIPPLITTLTGGIKETGAQELDYRAFFDELYLIHLRKMQGQSVPAEETLAPSQASYPLDDHDVPVLTQEVAAADAAAVATNAAEQDFEAMAQTARRLARAHDEARANATQSQATVAPKGAQQLIEILAKVDMQDAGTPKQRKSMAADLALACIETGVWMELIDSAGQVSRAKVAWINSRRTVFLLLRELDRRPLSLNAEHLLERLRKSTAFVLQG
jgi:Protein of unknown function (DUF1631)